MARERMMADLRRSSSWRSLDQSVADLCNRNLIQTSCGLLSVSCNEWQCCSAVQELCDRSDLSFAIGQFQ